MYEVDSRISHFILLQYIGVNTAHYIIYTTLISSLKRVGQGIQHSLWEERWRLKLLDSTALPTWCIDDQSSATIFTTLVEHAYAIFYSQYTIIISGTYTLIIFLSHIEI